MATNRELQILLTMQDEASKELKKTSSNFLDLKTVALSAGVAAATAVGAIGAASIKMAADFQASMSDINTLFDDNGEAIGELSAGVKDLLRIVPKSADDLGKSAYAIVSAGISDTAEALNVLEASSKLAVAGLGETSEATDIVTSAINAFGLEAGDADNIANMFFLTVKNGKTTVSELAQGFGQVAPLASEMGVQFEELMSITSAMTTSGMKASVAYTQVRALLSNMIKPTTDMQDAMDSLGWSVDDVKSQLSEGDGLIGTIRTLSDAVDGDTESLGKMFGSVEALNAVTMLLGETGDQAISIDRERLKQMDAMEIAFGKQTETIKAQYTILKNNLNVVLMELGSELLPVVSSAMGAITGSIQYFGQAVASAGGILSYFNSIFTQAMKFIEDNTGLITILKESFDNVAIVFRENLLPVLIEFWDAITPLLPFLEVLAKVFGVILLGAIIAFIKLLQTGLIVTIDVLTSTIKVATDVAQSLYNVWDNWTTILSKVVTWIDKVIESIKRLNVVQGAKSAISGAFGFGGGRASGGSVRGGTSYMVGERGPELFTPGGNGFITPNNKLSSGVTNVINVYGDVSGKELIEKVSEGIMNNLRTEQRLAVN